MSSYVEGLCPDTHKVYVQLRRRFMSRYAQGLCRATQKVYGPATAKQKVYVPLRKGLLLALDMQKVYDELQYTEGVCSAT